jgi:hypothetical protein
LRASLRRVALASAFRVACGLVAFAFAALVAAAPAGAGPENATFQTRSHPKPKADLSISVVPLLESVTVGNLAVYKVKVVNRGPRAASYVEVYFNIDSSADPVALVSEGGGYCVNRRTAPTGVQTLMCLLGKIAPEKQAVGSTVIMLQAQPQQPGPFHVVATVESPTPDQHPKDNRAEAETLARAGPASADLAVSIRSDTSQATLLQDFTETISVTNNGPTEASRVFVTVLYPLGAQFRLVDATPPIVNEVKACTSFQNSGPGHLDFCWDVIPSGQTVTMTLNLRPSSKAPSPLETNVVVTSVTPDPNLQNNRATYLEPLAPYHPNPGVDLVASLTPPAQATAGQEFTLGFQIVNRGADTAQGVLLSITSSAPLTRSNGGIYVAIDVFTDPEDQDEAHCSFGKYELDCSIPPLSSAGRVVGSVIGNVPLASSEVSATLVGGSSSADFNPSDNTATVDFGVGSRRH